MDASNKAKDLLQFTTQIVAAHVGNNKMAPNLIPAAIQAVYHALASLGMKAEISPTLAGKPQPAVPVKKSVFPDYIICLEDGKHLKMLKRHLQTAYGLTPVQYRARWYLPADYPMVAPNYALLRSSTAKRIGLGKSRGHRKDSRRSLQLMRSKGAPGK